MCILPGPDTVLPCWPLIKLNEVSCAEFQSKALSTSLFHFLKIRLVFAACLLIVISIHTYLLLSYDFELRLVLIDALVSNILLAACCVVITNSIRFYRPQKDIFIQMGALCVILMLLWLFISKWLTVTIADNTALTDPLFEHTLTIRACFAFLIFGWMAIISTLWYTLEEQRLQQQRRAETENIARKAELNHLRQQLQPHFLFNSLNSIIALISLRPEEARKMIHQLADFLRGTLKKDDNKQVSLAEECEHLALYLEIEKVRFGHRLKTHIYTDETCNQLLLPSMLLQPIVENAIKFGLYDTTENVTITIATSYENQMLQVTVSNPFDSNTVRPLEGTGFGLSGVSRRLFLLFSRNDLLETWSDNHQFITTVKIPQLS
jgi:two-component system LytT family sensor kinase